MPRSKEIFAASNIPDDAVVDGNTFHAYSIPAKIASLGTRPLGAGLEKCDSSTRTEEETGILSFDTGTEVVGHTTNKTDSAMTEKNRCQLNSRS